MDMQEADAGTGRARRAGGGPWVAAGANLTLGVFAILPFRYILWLTTYLSPPDHGDQSAGATSYDTAPYAASPVDIWGAGLSGLVILAMAVVIDVLMPRQEGWSTRLWLGTAALIPVPFIACKVLGVF
ncbi:hypothetical protein [Streptomyces sp. NBC_01257]|uniref:hypothetical protein n=1 Tax=Streptomyces sp. NBC_01257 TaxID=2903799 RepID=UPI002DDA0822|nr:hypothetical protein [Streptomyces sp. NBC_01257]WRZ66742.1 hypothetical protein OG408_23990 [Streptomyces sp. NBC_01257]